MKNKIRFLYRFTFCLAFVWMTIGAAQAQTVTFYVTNTGSNAGGLSNPGNGSSTVSVSGTLSVPSCATSVEGRAIGGGGGGGSADYNWCISAGGRGGGGGYAYRSFGNGGGSATVSAGRGGDRGEIDSPVNGADGVQSYITVGSATVYAYGGKGGGQGKGSFGCATSTGYDGAGGGYANATTGYNGTTGGNGNSGGCSAGWNCGAGGDEANGNSKGYNGYNYGGSGSGGRALINSKQPGGYGGGGIAYLSFYLPTPSIGSGALALCPGSTLSLSVANPNSCYSYQWLKDGVAISGQTGSTLNVSNITSANAGTYSVRVSIEFTRSGGNLSTGGGVSVSGNYFLITSAGRSVTVSAALTQGNPTGTTMCSGGTYTLSLAAATGGSGTITYQWQSSPNNSAWTNISGATSANYTTPVLTASTYYRRVATTATCGVSINSASALVTVVGCTISADKTTFCTGNPATIKVTSPNAAYEYRLYLGTTYVTILSANNNWSCQVVTAGTYKVEIHTPAGVLNTNSISITAGSGCYTPCTGGTILFEETFEQSGNPAVCSSNYTELYKDMPPTAGSHIESGTWARYDDHTYPNDITKGCYQYVNIDLGLSAQKEFFNTVMTGLCANNKLRVSFWVGNLMGHSNIGHVQPQLEVNVFRTGDATKTCVISGYGGQPYKMGIMPVDYVMEGTIKRGIWKQYAFDVTVPAGATSLTFEMSNFEGGPSGNDFVLDDIRVELCAPVPVITYPAAGTNTVSACGTPTFRGSFTNDGSFIGTLAARWEFSETGNENNPSEWTTVENTEKNPYTSGTEISFIATKEGYYRLVAACATDINSYYCRSRSRVIHFVPTNPKVTLLCPKSNVETCESDYILQASYSDNGALGDNLKYYWEYSVTGNEQIPSEWTKQEGTEGTTTDGTIVAQPFLVNQTGSYRLVVERNDGSGCVVRSNAVKITFNSAPILQVTDPPAVPFGQTVDITDPSLRLTNGTSFKYYNQDGISELSPLVAVAIEETGVYYIEAISNKGCATKKSIYVTILPDPLNTDYSLKVNKHLSGTFFGGPFIPSKTVSGTINGRTCYKADGAEIYGLHKYTFVATTNGVKNVRYFIIDPNEYVDTHFTNLYGSLTTGSLPLGSSVAMHITFKEDIPASTNDSVILYMIYYDGTEDVKVEKKIYIQNVTCEISIDNPVAPPCPPLTNLNSISQTLISNGYEFSVTVGGGSNNTIIWYVDGVKQTSTTNKFTFITAGKECGIYNIKVLVLSGCDCDTKIAERNIFVCDIVNRLTTVKVYYDAAGSRTFSKPASLSMETTLWGGGGGSGRAVCKGLALWYYDYVAVSGGGGGGGRSYAFLAEKNTAETVNLTVGAGGTGVSAGSNGDWSIPVAGSGGTSSISCPGTSVTANGGGGGTSAEAHYVFPNTKGKTDVRSGGSGGYGNTAYGSSASPGSGNNAQALLNSIQQYATSSNGGAAGQPGGGGTSCSSSGGVIGCPKTIYNTHDAIDSRPGNFPGGGASGAARINNGAWDVGNEKRVPGSNGATGRVIVDFGYLKPVQPVIDYKSNNVYEGINVTLEVHYLVYDAENCEYEWYKNGTVYPSFDNGRKCTINGAGIYTVKAKRKGVLLPATIPFANASNIVISPNADGSSPSGSGSSYTLNTGTVKNVIESKPVIFITP